MEVQLYSFFNIGARRGCMPRPGHFTPRERGPVPIEQEAGWALEPVWTGRENLANGVRPPDRPARSSRYTDTLARLPILPITIRMLQCSSLQMVGHRHTQTHRTVRLLRPPLVCPVLATLSTEHACTDALPYSSVMCTPTN